MASAGGCVHLHHAVSLAVCVSSATDFTYCVLLSSGHRINRSGETTGLDQMMQNYHQERTLTWQDDGM